MELTHIRYFIKIAECKSVTRASEELHVSQPWLSRMLKSLETELDAPLFQRSGRQMLLTPEGEAFYRSAKSAVNLLDSTAAAIRSSMHSALIISSPVHDVFLAALDEFRAAHPEVAVSYALSASDRANADFLTTSEVMDDADYESFPLFREEMLLLAPSSSVGDGVESVPLSDFKDRQFIFPGSFSPAAEACQHICNEAGFSPNIAMYSDNFAIIQKLIVMHGCVMLVPASGVSELSPGIAKLHLSPPAFRQIFLACRRRETQKISASLFRDFIADYFHKKSV